MKKRIISIVCIIALLLSFTLVGCGKGDKNDEEVQSKPDQEQEEKQDESKVDKEDSDGKEEDVGELGYKLPLVTEETTLTLGTIDNYYSPKSYTQNLPVWEEIEKNTGVKIEWDVTPSSDYGTVMSTRLAAGTDLPDIIMVPGDPMTYIKSGLLAPLDELIDEHAPNIKKMLEEDEMLKKMFTAPDGKTYTLSVPTDASNATNPYTWMVRKDWLDKVSLDEPATIDDWYEVLKAFKDKDPNENNQKDEVPYTVQNVSALLRFGNAWGLRLGTGGFHVEDDVVKFGYLLPEGKEFLTWLNRIYEEGLLDPDFASMNLDQYRARVESNKVGATVHFLDQLDNFQKSMQEELPDVEWITVVPPKGPNGQGGYMEKYGPISRYYSIIESSDKKELAIKWLDYTYATDEGNDYQTFGIEGLSYEIKDGKKVFTEFVTNNPDGLGQIDALRSIGAWPGTLYRQTEEYFLALQGEELKPLADKVVPYQVPNFPNMLLTQEESETMKAIWTDLSTYVDEMVLKFILGQEPLDKYEEFVETIKAMDIDKVLEVKQAQYDRYQDS